MKLIKIIIFTFLIGVNVKAQFSDTHFQYEEFYNPGEYIKNLDKTQSEIYFLGTQSYALWKASFIEAGMESNASLHYLTDEYFSRGVFKQNVIQWNNIYKNPSDVKVYIKSFEFLMFMNYGITTPANEISIEYIDLPDGIIHSNGINQNDKIILQIDEKKWYNSSIMDRIHATFRELGKDILNFKHYDGLKLITKPITKLNLDSQTNAGDILIMMENINEMFMRAHYAQTDNEDLYH